MQILKDKILKEGKASNGGVLKVDSFINHQIDPMLMKSIASTFLKKFSSKEITKIVTIEASGIAPAVLLGYLLEVPVVFVKKAKPKTMENMLVSSVYSFTKDTTYPIFISKEYIKPEDKVLFIDDFLANGNAALSVLGLLEQTKAKVIGMGFVIEKSFQNGGKLLREKGIDVVSLARVKELADNKIIFETEEN